MADDTPTPGPIAPAPLDPEALQDYITALEQLHDLLDEAYWVATTIEAKDAINGLSQAVFDILTTLHEQAIQANTPQYTALKATVDAVNAKLQTVQGQINDWIHKIDVAGQVVAGIAQAVALAAKVFTL
jgi:DNA repair ATPase RecN